MDPAFLVSFPSKHEPVWDFWEFKTCLALFPGKCFLLELLWKIVLELLDLTLVIEVDGDDDSEDRSLIELAGEILEENLVTDTKSERLELLDLILSLEAILDGVLTTEQEEGCVLVPASTFLFKEFDGDLLILQAKLLLEDEQIVDFAFVASGRPKEDLDNVMGLSPLTWEPLTTVVFITELTLPEKGQIKLKVNNSWEQDNYKKREKKKIHTENSNHNFYYSPCPFHFWHEDRQWNFYWMILLNSD